MHGVRCELSFTAYWLLCCWTRANWICRVSIVINKLTEVREDVDFHERLRRRGRNGFPIFAVGGWSSCPATNSERMFPLLGQTFRVDVVIPHHQRPDERVRHAPAGKRKARKAFVASVRLANEDAVVPLCERSASTGRAARCVGTKRNVR